MKPRGHWRWLAAGLTGVASLALAIYVAARFSPPRLEPLPEIPQYLVAAPIRALVEQKRRVVERNPGSAEAWGALGSAFARQCDAEALVCFRNAERLEPANYRWSYLQGACQADHDTRQAIECFARSARLAPDRPHVQLRLADYLLEQADLAGARLAIERSLAVDPADPHAHLSQARLHFFKGNLAEARIWAEKSAALAPDKRDTHVFLAQLYRRLGDRASEERARETLARMADTPTSWDDPDVASVHALQDSARTAAKTQPAESDEQDPLAALRQAQKHIADGRLADAEDLIREQLRLHPDHERFHFQLGVACFQQERYEEAAREFRRVSELKPDHSDAQYNLGHALLKLNRPAEAKAAFTAAVRLRPGYAFARINLAELLLEEGKTDEAREHLQAALQIAPGDSRAQQLLERAKAAP
jgi:tetratricopeptide (TPR) repeat protein